MKTTLLALVASIGLAFVAPSLSLADVTPGNVDKKVTAPKGPMGKVPADADKDAKLPKGKLPKVKLSQGKTHNDVHGKNASLDCKSPKLDAKMKKLCEGPNADKRS